MNQAELIEQFVEALRHNLKAAPPPGLDTELAEAVRALFLTEMSVKLDSGLQARMWHRALSQAQGGQSNFRPQASLNGKHEPLQNLRVLKPNERLQLEGDDPNTVDSDSLTSGRSIPGTRPPNTRHALQYTLTLAAAVLVIVFLGGILIQMVSDPVDGYPALVDITQEPTPELPLTCESFTDPIAGGEAAIIAGDYETAAFAYNCVMEADPDNLATGIWLGGLNAANGDYDTLGFALYNAFSHRAPGTDPTSVSMARMMPTLTSAIQSRPDDATLYLLRGIAYFIADLRSNAASDFDQMMTLAPDNAVGYIFKWTLKPEPALLTDDDLEKGMELAPNSALMDWILSMEFTQATAELWKPHYDWAIETNPKHLFAYEARGIANIFLGDLAGAADDFYQHIQNNQQQEIWEENVTLGEPVSFDTTPGDVYRLTFTATMWQKLDIVAIRGGYAAISRVYPPTQVVLNPAGEVMAAPYDVVSGLGASTTPIRGLEIPANGVYTVLVIANSGGPLTVTISETS